MSHHPSTLHHMSFRFFSLVAANRNYMLCVKFLLLLGSCSVNLRDKGHDHENERWTVLIQRRTTLGKSLVTPADNMAGKMKHIHFVQLKGWHVPTGASAGVYGLFCPWHNTHWLPPQQSKCMNPCKRVRIIDSILWSVVTLIIFADSAADSTGGDACVAVMVMTTPVCHYRRLLCVYTLN